MENFVKTSLVFSALFISLSSGSNYGPPGPIEFHYLSECESGLNLVDFQYEMQKESDDSPSAKVSFELESEGTGLTVTAHADQCDDNGENCEKDAYVIEDKDLFSFLDQFFPQIWDNFKNQVNPQIEDRERIPAGKYSVEHFQADYKDINTPQVAYGTTRAQIEVFQDGEGLLCVVVEGNIRAPPM